ncbi:hypothetical protein FB561_2439 [Kribbella amoyensis]|uniref:Uncharacterized protein n=1 Tax=Kribbella amoyensis TaxID=996641 RepID=A0A561BR21_9ACTN|nr:hypothetical protein [Kribbella amoyensis]TWD81327.1 hypothetical protein FB561_2439 [Kribbella amoyensis]
MSQGPINFGGVGDIDMHPEQTGALTRRLHDAGAVFGREVPAAEGSINAGEQEADTGFDTLSKNFRAAYNASEPQLDQLNRTVQRLLEDLGNGGTRIVAEYVQQAEQDAARMRSLE